jgi:hypothetical protein
MTIQHLLDFTHHVIIAKSVPVGLLATVVDEGTQSMFLDDLCSDLTLPLANQGNRSYNESCLNSSQLGFLLVIS